MTMTTTTTTNGEGLPVMTATDIRPEREVRGLTREQLAIRAGCSVTMLAQIERGVIPRRGYVLPKILRALEEAA